MLYFLLALSALALWVCIKKRRAQHREGVERREAWYREYRRQHRLPFCHEDFGDQD